MRRLSQFYPAHVTLCENIVCHFYTPTPVYQISHVWEPIKFKSIPSSTRNFHRLYASLYIKRNSNIIHRREIHSLIASAYALAKKHSPFVLGTRGVARQKKADVKIYDWVFFPMIHYNLQSDLLRARNDPVNKHFFVLRRLSIFSGLNCYGYDIEGYVRVSVREIRCEIAVYAYVNNDSILLTLFRPWRLVPVR